MEQQSCNLMYVTDWEGIAFLLKLDPGTVNVQDWGIHSNRDKVIECLQPFIFELIILTDRW